MRERERERARRGEKEVEWILAPQLDMVWFTGSCERMWE